VRQLGPEAGEKDRQVVAFGFYLWNYEKKEQFGARELGGCFRALGLPVPEDLAAICGDLAERRRFFDAGSAPERWQISQKGRNYVKTRLLSGA
jgi:hypothetical protein